MNKTGAKTNLWGQDIKRSLALWPVDQGLTSSVQMSTFITGLAISAALPSAWTTSQQLKWAVLFTQKKAGNTTDVISGLKHFTKMIKIKKRALRVWLLIQLLPFLPQWRLQILLGHGLLDGVLRKAIWAHIQMTTWAALKLNFFYNYWFLTSSFRNKPFPNSKISNSDILHSWIDNGHVLLTWLSRAANLPAK